MMKRTILFSLVLLFCECANAKLPDLIPYRKGNLWGYCDSTKKIVIPCRFSEARLFNGDSASGSLDNISGYIMKNGEFHPYTPPAIISYPWLIPTIPYPIAWTWYVGSLSEKCAGLIPFQDSITGLSGYKNCKNKIAIPCIYQEANYFSDGLARVTLFDTATSQTEYGYINEKGKMVLKFNADYQLNDFMNGRAIMGFNERQGVIDKRGNFIILPFCYQILDEGNFFVTQNGDDENYLLLDRDGNWKDRRTFTEFSQMQNNFWMTEIMYGDESYRYGFFDSKGKEAVPFIYSNALGFTEGLAAVSDSTELWGFVNEKGKVVIPIKYLSVISFQNGIAIVSDSSNFFGLINKKGEAVTPIKYLAIEDFENGMAKVQSQSELWGFINEKGKEIIEAKYLEENNFQNGLVAVRNDNDQWGFLDSTGKVIIPLQYAMPVNGGFDANGLCEIGDKGYIDIHGTEYWEE